MALTPTQESQLIAMIPAFENGLDIPAMTEATTCDETELIEVSQGGVTKKMSIGTAVSKLSTKGYLYLGIATTATVPLTYGSNDRVYYSIDCPTSATTLTLTNFGNLVIPILTVPTRYSLRWEGTSWSGVVDKVSNISQTVGTSTVNVPSENAVLGNVTELESVICGIKTQGYELINGVEFLNSGYIAASDGSENISTDYYFSDYKLVVPFSVISMMDLS